MTVLTCVITDKAIREHVGQYAELADTKFTGLRLRYLQGGRGSWFLVFQRDGKRHWKKLASWPEVKPPAMRELASKKLVELALRPDTKLRESEFVTVGELLEWYKERLGRDRDITKTRKASSFSLINNHLLPYLSSLSLDDVQRKTLDNLFMLPLQEVLAPSSCRQVFSILKAAFSRAERLQLIPYNPVAGFRFGDFNQSQILPKVGRLHVEDASQLLQQLAHAPELAGQLALMSLLHGTRIGELRQARWADINVCAQVWRIPVAHIKTRKKVRQDHVLPLTPMALAVLNDIRCSQAKRGYRGAFVFAGANGCLSTNEAHQLIRQVSKRQWTNHDLRKFLRSSMQELGIDTFIAERAINHSVSAIMKTYNHGNLDRLLREAFLRYHAFLKGEDKQDFLCEI